MSASPPQRHLAAVNSEQPRDSTEPLDVALAVPPALVEAVATRAAQLVLAQLATTEDTWLDVEGAARHLACKPRRIYDLHSQRRIPAHKDGSRLLFRRSELDAYVERAA